MKNIISLILIVVSILVFFFYIQPEYGMISNLQAQKADYTDALAKAKDIKTLSDQLVTQYNSISSDDQAKLAAMIPSNFNSVKLVSDINDIAARYGMAVKGVTISTQADNNQSADSVTATPSATVYKTATITFTVLGSYSSFVSFLKDLEDNVELIDVTKLDVHSGGTSNAALNFGVGIQTYYIN